MGVLLKSSGGMHGGKGAVRDGASSEYVEAEYTELDESGECPIIIGGEIVDLQMPGEGEGTAVRRHDVVQPIAREGAGQVELCWWSGVVHAWDKKESLHMGVCMWGRYGGTTGAMGVEWALLFTWLRNAAA